MKRDNIFISENRTAKRVSVVKFVAPGDVPDFDCSIHFGEKGNDVTMQNCIIKNNLIVKCSPEDTYDFEVGALIALMKMCGVEKVVRACNEAFSEDTFKTYATKYERELNDLKKDFDKVKGLKEYYKKNYEVFKEYYDKLGDKNKYLIDDINTKLGYLKEKDEEIKHLKEKNAELLESNSCLRYTSSCKESTIKTLENTINGLTKENKELKKNINELFESEQHTKSELGRLYFEKHRLEEQVEKLKLDCEKLQHGYNADVIICGGRGNGKQYTFLVDLFKKIDQKKVDAAYKEAYNTTLPVWQKEALRQAYEIHTESKEKTELPRTLDINGTVYRKTIQIKGFGEQIRPLTKREEMWENILGASKCPPVDIKVDKQDIKVFLKELQDRIPEARWNGSDCLPTENTNPYWFKHDCIYFALFRYDDKGNLRLCYSENKHSWIDKPVIEYLPPMHWDLFKNGRLAVKVNYDNYKEFYEACEKELGKKPSTVYPGDYTVSICKKDGLFEIFTVEDNKKAGRKIVDWEDVRDNTSTMEDPYDTWKW